MWLYQPQKTNASCQMKRIVLKDLFAQKYSIRDHIKKGGVVDIVFHSAVKRTSYQSDDSRGISSIISPNQEIYLIILSS